MIILLHIHPGIHCFDMLFTSIITLDRGKVTHNHLVAGIAGTVVSTAAGDVQVEVIMSKGKTSLNG
jgi:hypothetical protein